MYICRDCGTIFEEPKHYSETHGLDNPPYEEYSGCPECGGDYNETYMCSECGQYIFGDFVELKNGECYCSDCYMTDNIIYY